MHGRILSACAYASRLDHADAKQIWIDPQAQKEVAQTLNSTIVYGDNAHQKKTQLTVMMTGGLPVA